MLHPDGFDPRSPSVIQDPFPVFQYLQDEDPAHWSSYLQGWVFTRYHDVREALTWSVDRIAPFMKQRSAEDRQAYEDLQLVALWSSFNDAPVHTHLRKLMSLALTAELMESAAPVASQLVDELLQKVKHRGEMDVMEDFAYQIPIGVMAELLGLPRSDVDTLRLWSEEINLFVGAAKDVPNKYRRAASSVRQMTDYFNDKYRERQRNPGDDLVSRLIIAEHGGDRLSCDEVVATCVMLTYAGHVTTAHLLGNGVLALLRNPDQLRLLHDNPVMASQATEELLRYDGPVQAMVRVADKDVELHGRTIRQGDRIFPMLNAANRDPRRFDEPHRLNLQRKGNAHIVFGHGPHTCIGLRLARVEIPIAISAFVDVAKDVAQDDPVEWTDSIAFRGPASLRVRFRTDFQASLQGREAS